MKMTKRLLILVGLTVLVSCTHTPDDGPLPEDYSGCYPLPVGKEDLGYQSVRPLGKDGEALLLSGKKRSLLSTYYYASLADGEVELEGLKPLNWSDQSVIFGSGMINNKLVTAMYSPVSATKSGLELREVRTNFVMALSRPERSKKKAGQVVVDNPNGFWLLERTDRADDEYSFADQPHTVSYVKMLANEKLEQKQVRRLTVTGEPKLIAGGLGKNAIVFWLEDKTDKNGTTTSAFRYREVYSDGSKAAIRTLSYKPSEPVESFDLIRNGDSLYLASIEGDSLVGDAKGSISKIFWNASYLTVAWTKNLALDGDHVSNPKWVATKGSTHLFLPKWHREKVTIARYDVAANEIKAKDSFGRYSEGTAITDVFYNAKSEKFSVLLRKKQKNYSLKEFMLCKQSL